MYVYEVRENDGYLSHSLFHSYFLTFIFRIIEFKKSS